MRNYADPNCTVNREQQAVGGKLLFVQKSKLLALHIFAATEATGDEGITFDLTINGENVGTVTVDHPGANKVASSGLLDIVIPQGSIVEVGGGDSVVAEYVVLPDADETTGKAITGSFKPADLRHA